MDKMALINPNEINAKELQNCGKPFGHSTRVYNCKNSSRQNRVNISN